MDIVERLRWAAHAADDPDVLNEAADEIERLLNAIKRIDGINDNPADYNSAINDVCDAILRPEAARR